MQIISFAWTTSALLAGAKDRTRRKWNASYAVRFCEGRKCVGYNQNARYGGYPVAVVQITRDAYPERTGKMTEEDYVGEGFLFMEKEGLKVRGVDPRFYFEEWKRANEMVYVLHFKMIPLEVYRATETYKTLPYMPR